MNKILITRVTEGDWQGLYVNGQLEKEAHQIRIEDLSEYCPIETFESKYILNFDSDKDSLPETEKELMKKFKF